MGLVFEGVHEAIERRVAIKVLHPEYARNAEFTARFFNEARAVNRVAHPGLVQVSDYGQQPDGTAYIVMELLEGESLAHRMVQRGGKLTNAEVVHLGWQIADSLASAHDKGIVHRDLKPDNVMIVADSTGPGGERTKLLDFGIAKITERGAVSHVKTKTDQVLGTPTYMSPEQCEGAGNVDAKSDVYSLGVMLFELLAGQPPFVAQGGGKVLGMHMFVAPPLLRDAAAHVPARLADLVQRLLAKQREQRPTMRQLVHELTALAEEHPLPKRAEMDHAAVASSEDPRTKPFRPLSSLGLSASQATKISRRRPWLTIAGAIGLTLILGTVGLLMNKSQKPSVSPSAPIASPIPSPPTPVSKPSEAAVLTAPIEAKVARPQPHTTPAASLDRALPKPSTAKPIENSRPAKIAGPSAAKKNATSSVPPHMQGPVQKPSKPKPDDYAPE